VNVGASSGINNGLLCLAVRLFFLFGEAFSAAVQISQLGAKAFSAISSIVAV
jgi:hypothetical protein